MPVSDTTRVLVAENSGVESVPLKEITDLSFINTTGSRKTGGALLFNTLGDSISAFPIAAGKWDAGIQNWAPNTFVGPRSIRKNGNFYFFTTAGGTTGSTGPSRTNLATPDGTVTWINRNAITAIPQTFYGFWLEIFSRGRLNFNMDSGFNGPQDGLNQIIVVNGGSGYTNPSLSNADGIEVKFNVVNGVIKSVDVLSGSAIANVLAPPLLSDPTGTGAKLNFCMINSGTFGVSGARTIDIAERAPLAAASNNDIITVMMSTNDIANNVTYANIISNIKTTYDTLLKAGKKVVAITTLVRTGTTAQKRLLNRVNNFIRAYVRGESWANTFGYANIVLADPTVYMTDGATDGDPIGGSAGLSGAMTYDGLHPSTRGAFYIGYTIWEAVKHWCGNPAPVHQGTMSAFDAYDSVEFPEGNLLEGYPWLASTAYKVGDLVRNDSGPAKVYYCIGAGTSAGAGGPTGTASSITDGTVTWAYAHSALMSVFRSGTGGVINPAAGVTITGNLANGYFMQRNTGTASGSLTATIESPWSNGQPGQRQVLQFSLGSGGTTEDWLFQILGLNYERYGILPSDLGVTRFELEIDLEVSGLLKLNKLQPIIQSDYAASPPNDFAIAQVGTLGNGNVVNGIWPASTGEMVAYPNGGAMTLKTKPCVLPYDLGSLALWMIIGFEASGGAGSATATIKINKVAFRKVP